MLGQSKKLTLTNRGGTSSLVVRAKGTLKIKKEVFLMKTKQELMWAIEHAHRRMDILLDVGADSKTIAKVKKEMEELHELYKAWKEDN